MELPYTLVQDSTLFVMLGETTSDVWKQKVDWIAARGGMALLNVHPDYVAFDGCGPRIDEFPVDYYVEFLAWMKRSYRGQYWQTLPREVADYCRKEMHQVLSALVVLDSSQVLLSLASGG
jgi:hypothetical protein